jgi:CheY-like chemotaxis protein
MLHILLVDDDEDEHLFFEWSLEKIETGICLTSVFSGAQALKHLTERSADIIFLDINLPGADGFECLRSIRNMQRYQEVSVYMYSTEITGSTLKRASELGAGCIKKSRNHDHLAKIIREKVRATSSIS